MYSYLYHNFSNYGLRTSSIGITRDLMDFPGGSDVKQSTCNVRDLDSILGLGRSSGGAQAWQSTQEFLPGKSHGQRSLAGYSPWDITKSLDTTEHTHKQTLPQYFIFISVNTVSDSPHRENCDYCLGSQVAFNSYDVFYNNSLLNLGTGARMTG